jgi:hypothetical protein
MIFEGCLKVAFLIILKQTPNYLDVCTVRFVEFDYSCQTNARYTG